MKLKENIITALLLAIGIILHQIDVYKRQVKNKEAVEEYEVLLSNEELRKEFYETLSKFGRHLKLALESERVYNSLSSDEINKYKKDFKFYQELRKSVKIRYSDTIDHKEYEAQMQKPVSYTHLDVYKRQI